MLNWDTLKEYAEVIIIALVVALIIRSFVVQAFKIPSESMLETLQIGDHILVNKFIYWFTPVKRGDIMVFKYPRDNKIDFIKRVVGMPGDTVEIHEKRVFINHIQLEETFAVYKDPNIDSRRDNFGPAIVPPDSYFVMGDNRDRSQDGRFWGFLPQELIKGKAFFIYWPLSRIGMINSVGREQ